MNASTLSSMLASPLPPSFRDTYSLSMSSLGCNAYAWSLVFLFFDPFKFISCPLEKGSRISNEGHSPSIYSFDKVSAGDFRIN